jgi:hypothetical protein
MLYFRLNGNPNASQFGLFLRGYRDGGLEITRCRGEDFTMPFHLAALPQFTGLSQAL